MIRPGRRFAPPRRSLRALEPVSTKRTSASTSRRRRAGSLAQPRNDAPAARPATRAARRGASARNAPETIRCTAAGRVTIAPQLVRLTFRAAIREVLDDYRMNRKRSLVDVQRHVRLHLEPFFGRRRMAAIATADVRRYVAQRHGEGAKNATVNR